VHISPPSKVISTLRLLLLLHLRLQLWCMVHCDHASIWHRYRGMAPQSTCTQTHRHKHGTTDKTTNLYLLQCSLRSLGGDNKYNDDDHTSHGSVSVVRTTFKVYGKMQTLTLSQPKTPEPIVTKF